MEIKNIVFKYLLMIVGFELILDLLKLFIPLQIQYLEFSYIFEIVRGILLIFLLKDFYKAKIDFKYVL